MRNILSVFTLLGLYFWNVTLHAQSLENTLLWKIEGKRIKTSYLFGTVHMLPKADFEMDEKVKTAFAKCQQLIMELDISDPGMQMQMMGKMQMQNGVTLKKLLGKEEFQKLSEYLKKELNADIISFNQIKPFFISSMLTPKMMGTETASFEAVLLDMAKAKEMEVSGLETVAEQMAVFDSIPYRKQAEDVLEMIDNEAENKQMLQDLVAKYKEEAVNDLYALITSKMKTERELRLLLENRNKNWVTQIPNIAKKQSSFFAVGAGHLGGENGVIQLLRKQGYTLTPVSE